VGFITYPSVAGAPVTIEADDKWVELVAELDRIDLNNEHAYHRQDRKYARLCSWEAYNAHGNQLDGAHRSAEEEACDNETADEIARTNVWLHDVLEELIADLPEVQRAVFVAVVVHERPAVEVAAERGVSKAAISKTLKKALTRLRAGLEAAGVNSADVSGLPVSGTPGVAQEGH
jgi:sigma-70, region 4